MMNTTDYDCAMTRLLSDKNNYEIIPFNLKYKSAAKIKQIIKSYQGTLLSAEQVTDLLKFTNDPADRNFYGLPKTHKPKEK